MGRSRFVRVDPPQRRRSLVEATMRVLARSGAAGASVRAIALEAQVSPGLVAHHFDGVEALIAAAYAQVDGIVTGALAAAVTRAGDDPQARLLAYVTSSFAPPIADPDLLRTWVAFWSLTGSNAEVARLHERQYTAYREGLETLLDQCGLPRAEQRQAAIGLAALVDGLWLELCLSPAAVTPADAHAISARQLAGYFDRSV